MPIVIGSGTPDFTGAGESISKLLLAKRAQDLDRDRYETLRKRVEQEMSLNDAEEQRRATEFQALQDARAKAPGIIGGMFDRPAPPNMPDAGTIGPSNPNSEDAQFQASVRANTERMGKIAAEIAKSDPTKGMEYAKRFLDEEQQNLHRLVADRGITGMMKEVGEGLTTPGTYTVNDPNNPEGDPTYPEAMKGVLQELQTAQGPEVTPEQKVAALQNANETRRHIRKEITARNEKVAATMAARSTIEQRAAEAGQRLTTAQKARLGGLAANVGFEEGMVPPDKVDSEVERILRGTVVVPNPFSFGGGDETLEMTPESAAKFQETLAKIQLVQQQQAATQVLGTQRRAAAELSGKRGENLNLPRNGSSRGPLADEKDIASIMRQRFPQGATTPEDQAAATAMEKDLRSKASGPDSPESLRADILGKRLTKPEAETRARKLGLSYDALKALLESK